jgi:xanthine dehydrogenase accessory factor
MTAPAAEASPQTEFTRLARENERGALATVVGPEGDEAVGRKLLVRADGSSSGGLGAEALDAAARTASEELLWAERSELRELAGVEVFVDVVAPPPRLFILGAVDYAAALCRLARAAGWRPYVCDPRRAFATRERFPEAEDVIAAWPDEAFARLGIDRATYIAILTHDPKLDDAALRLALRSDAAYVGAMGSRRAQARRRERLIEAGMAEAELDRLAAPIGLDLGATSPEETALSILAEVVAVRNGHGGGRLSASAAGRIHEVGA